MKFVKLFIYWSLYTCLTQLYCGIDMYNLLHKEQLHVSALVVLYVINYTYLYHEYSCVRQVYKLQSSLL